MRYPTTGYYPELTREQKKAIELASVRLLVRLHPENNYWRNMLAGLEAKYEVNPVDEAQEIEREIDAELVYSTNDVWVWTDDPRTLEEIDRDLQAQEWNETYRSL